MAARGDHTAAEAEYQAVLEDQTRIFGPDSPATLRTRRRLAEVCQKMGLLDKAISQYQSVLTDCERALGGEHPLTEAVRKQAIEAASQL
jgi:hypothetical protein